MPFIAITEKQSSAALGLLLVVWFLLSSPRRSDWLHSTCPTMPL
jgi:hypothetical protein